MSHPRIPHSDDTLWSVLRSGGARGALRVLLAALALVVVLPTAAVAQDDDDTAAPGDGDDVGATAEPTDAGDSQDDPGDDGADESDLPPDDGDPNEIVIGGDEADDPNLTDSERARREAIFGGPMPVPEGVDEATRAEYEAYRKAAERYWREVEEYRKDLNAFVKSEYDSKLDSIDRAYQTQIDAMRDEIRDHREDAIVRMEQFLSKHPDNERYAPGVLYRLAVLHYEKSDEEYLAAPPGSMLVPDFSTSVDYAEALIRRFPDFPQLDGAYYLLGFCHLEMEQEENARDAFLALVEKHPDSAKAPEALTRIGEYYFSASQGAVLGEDGGTQWDKAREYYGKAVEYGPEYRIYDRALYRLAWTEYYNEDYDSMLRRFIDLVEYADQVPQGSSLRQEAIDFMAAVLAEEDWNLQDDISYDANFGMTRFDSYLNEGRPFELEVLRVYADTLVEMGRHDFAAEAYAALLERDVCNPDNPRIHQAYIAALNLNDQRAKAVEVQSGLDSVYGPGSEWYACQEQEGNLEAIAYAESMARKALKFSIATYHTRANELYDEEDALVYDLEGASDAERPALEAKLAAVRDEKREAFATTARITEEFLKRYPNDQDGYLYRYILAESYYEAGNYERAAEAFAQVRDITDGRKRRDAANGAIDARSILLTRDVDAGSADPLALTPFVIRERYEQGLVSAEDVPTYILREVARESGDESVAALVTERDAALEAAADEGKRALSPRALDPATAALVDARDKYVEYDLDSRRKEDQAALAPEYKYFNAMVFYHHDDMDEARRRFNDLVDNHAETEYAALSAGFIIESYRQEADLDMVAEESGRLSQKKLGSGEKSEELAQAFENMKYDALFAKARQLFQAEQYAEAAYEYERIVNENPTYEDIHLALYNAGVAYERIKRYESAMRLYGRVVNEYASEPEAADALFRVGVNGERFFDFDAAVGSYLEYHDQIETEGFSDEQLQAYENNRIGALRQAAIILKYTEDYERAAELFERYHDQHTEREDAAELLFEAGAMYEKMGDYSRMARTFDKFRDTYGGSPDFRLQVLDTYLRQGDYFKARNDPRRAVKFYEQASGLYRDNPSVGGKQAGWYAAKAQFQIADIEFQDWDAISLEGSMKQFKQRIEEKKTGSQAVAQRFNQVLTFKNPEWSMAATYRIGSMFHGFADSLENAKCPESLDDDVCDGLLEGLLEASLELNTQARVKYEEVLSFGQKADVVNEWTRRSLNGLNDIAPREYPLFEGERQAMKAETRSAGGLMTSASLAGDADAEADGEDSRDTPKGLDGPGGGNDDEQEEEDDFDEMEDK